MPDTLYDRERTALSTLLALVRDRADAEARVGELHRQAADEAEKEVQKARRKTAADRKKAKDDATDAHHAAAADIAAKYAGRQTAADRKRAEMVRAAEDTFERTDEKLRTAYKDRLWTIDSLFEAGEKEADDQMQKLVRQAETGHKRIAANWDEIAPHLTRVGWRRRTSSTRRTACRRPPRPTPRGSCRRTWRGRTRRPTGSGRRSSRSCSGCPGRWG